MLPVIRRGRPIRTPLPALGLLAILAGAGWGSAFAQPAEEPKVKLPPVEVVGTHLQRSPQTATTITGARLIEAGILSTIDLRRAVPNLSQGNAGLRSLSDNYAIRGIGNTEFLSDPAVVLYVDGAPFGDNSTYTTDLLAVDRVDVYRGPQGSRFGKNAAAGAISIVTHRPTDQLGVEGSASGASFDTWQYGVSAVGPLVQNRSHFTLAGQYGASDGFIRNAFLETQADRRESFNGRASLHWTPRKSWDVSLAATLDRFRDGLGIVSLAGDPRVTMSEIDGKIDTDANSQSLRIDGEAAGVAVTNVTTRRDFRMDPFLFDPDFSPFPGNTGVVKYTQPQWTEELRLRPAHPADHRDWLAGLFFSTSETDLDRTVTFFLPPAGSGSDDIRSTEGAETYALFGEITHPVGARLDATLGLRLDYSLRELHRTHASTLGSPPPVDADEGFFNAAPKLTLGYQVREEVLLYGSTGLGFKPGGFSSFIDPPASPKFDTETTWANEIGVKSSHLNGALTANVAAFYYDVTDYQIEQQTPTGFEFTIVNAPQARSLGAELEVSGRPAPGWELSGLLGYTDARLDRYTDPFSGTTVADTRVPFVAELNGGAAVQYRHAIGLFARVEGVFIGDTYHDAANTPAFGQSAYGLLHARAGFERGRFAVTVFGENLTDAEYYLKKIPPLNAGAPGRPQAFGVRITAR
jgi:iron complex outermembrane receptor protein